MTKLIILISGCLFFSTLFGKFPEIISDVFGDTINMKDLAKEKTVVIITMKSPDCPVCQYQITRIMQYFDQLVLCNVTFIVLSPGPGEQLNKVKNKTQFPFPFVVDNELKIARSLNLLLSKTEILPSILILNEQLEIAWTQKGRNVFYFGDPELMKHLKCEGWI